MSKTKMNVLAFTISAVVSGAAVYFAQRKTARLDRELAARLSTPLTIVGTDYSRKHAAMLDDPELQKANDVVNDFLGSAHQN